MRIWPSTPPADCPFESSDSIKALAFTGRHAEYTGADTWYPSWASDDVLYSPWTDGFISHPVEVGFDLHRMECSSDSRNRTNAGKDGMSGTGQARIRGDDPLNLTIETLGVHYASPAPYGGRYPCGSLVHNGVWYYGTYCLDESDRGLNWDILGPFVGFRLSRDFGRTWQDTPHTPDNPILGESGKGGGKVKIGAPHFVDFGKNLMHSPDGKAYMVGHGATRPDADLAWIAGDQVYLLRVTPSPETINDPSQYLLVITDGWPTIEPMNTYILESDRITGPWKLVTFMEKFGQQAYFVNFPSRFISDDGKTLWLCYSANFSNLPGVYDTHWESDPAGSKYALCLQEVVLSLA
jgi:hypothetical protein